MTEPQIVPHPCGEGFAIVTPHGPLGQFSSVYDARQAWIASLDGQEKARIKERDAALGRAIEAGAP